MTQKDHFHTLLCVIIETLRNTRSSERVVRPHSTKKLRKMDIGAKAPLCEPDTPFHICINMP